MGKGGGRACLDLNPRVQDEPFEDILREIYFKCGHPEYHGDSRPPGWKVRIGDLAADISEGSLWSSIWTTFEANCSDSEYGQLWGSSHRDIYQDILRIDVKSGRAQSGASYATITTSSWRAAYHVARVAWDWLSQVTPDSPMYDERPRLCAVHFLPVDRATRPAAAPPGQPSSSAGPAAPAPGPRAYGTGSRYSPSLVGTRSQFEDRR